MTRSRFAALAALATLLALTVVVLGAYVRLSHAGLGCPDWPGCYGHLTVPDRPEAVAAANAAYPERPLHSAKAWKEMAHRYLASGLGLSILVLAGLAWAGRPRPGLTAMAPAPPENMKGAGAMAVPSPRPLPKGEVELERAPGATFTVSGERLPVALPTLLVGLVIFQGLLGMWTVTQLVNPSIVTLHLAGGLATLALLWWLTLTTGRLWVAHVSPELGRLRPWAWLGLGLLCLQVLLGGWTSTHYAALACPEFPTCYGGQWWPEADFRAGFSLLRPVGVDYEGGTLHGPGRTAIHLAHRVGALVVFLYLGTLALVWVRRAGQPLHRRLAKVLLAVLVLQLGLGIANILWQLPLPLAAAHNAGAALLLLTLVTLVHALTPPRPALGRAAAPNGV